MIITTSQFIVSVNPNQTYIRITMKKLLLAILLISGMWSYKANAQMTAGCVAPDFTATDINGTTWHLYDILNTGKTVYIDVSATWCGPCWSYHSSGALEGLYNQYGPLGTNEVMVFMVEGDGTTNTQCLYGPSGCNSSTQGNWVNGTPYPIIDNATIANQLQISYFPTIYMVCPDRIIREVGQLSTAQLYAQKSNCSQSSQPVDAGITNSSVCLNGTLASCTDVDVSYRLCNYGANPLTACDVNLAVPGTSTQQSYHWTGSLNTYESTVLTFSNVSAPPGASYQAVITTSNPNGTTDPVAANNSNTTDFLMYPTTGGPAVAETYAASTFPPAGWYRTNGGSSPTWARSTAGYSGVGSAKMDFYSSPAGDLDILQAPAMDLSGLQDAVLTFDVAYAQYSGSNDNLKIKVSTDCGASWVMVYNKSGASLSTAPASSSAFTPSSNAQWRNEAVSFSNYVGNNNVFIRFDALSDYGNNLYIDNVNMNFNTGTGTITVPVSFSVYPNPASSLTNIDFSLTQKDNVTIEVFNKIGKQVFSATEADLAPGAHNYTINTEGYAKGIYMVSIKTSAGSSMKKLVVE